MTRQKHIQLPDDERKELLLSLIDKLQAHSPVSVKQIKAALTTDESKQFAHEFKTATRGLLGPMPKELREYGARLRIADQVDERINKRKRPHMRSGLDVLKWENRKRDAAAEYENALEVIEGALSVNPGCAAWLDRPVTFGQTSRYPAECTADGVPRLINSRTSYSEQYSHSQYVSTRERQREVILYTLKDSLKDLVRSSQTKQKPLTVSESLHDDADCSDDDFGDNPVSGRYDLNSEADTVNNCASNAKGSHRRKGWPFPTGS